MAYDNAQMAQAWGDLLGLTPSQVNRLQSDFDQWAVGGARLATWSRLATDVNLFNNAAVRMVHDWYGGTANGGPNGDGLYPLMNSEAEVFYLPSPARIMADLAGFNPLGTLPDPGHLPATGESGDLWIIADNAWAWNSHDAEWKNLGPFRGAAGLSAKAIVIAAGKLPSGATDQDFADWLADSQIDRVQPYLIDAENARDAAQQALRDTATLADRVVDDATAVEADRRDAVAAAQTATTKADDAETARAAAVTLRNQAEQFRNEAEQFKNEAGEIAGGDFLTQVQADALYRKLADALGIADVTGLAAALAAKATPADITAAINALVDGAPTALDTLKELADALADSDDALAALVLAIGAKADLVDGKVPAAQLATATTAQVRAGKTSGVVIEPDEAAGAMALVPLTDAATVVIDLDTGPNFTLTTTAGVGVGRTIGLPTNGNVGQYYTVRFTAHAGATVAWNTAFKWPGGTAQAITNTAGAITEVAFKMISASRFDVVGFVKDIR